MHHLLRRVWYAVRYGRHQADLTEEMAFHREMARRELEEGGLESTEADFAAHRAFGSAPLARDRARDVWIWPWVQDLWRDVRFASRLLNRDRSFTIVTAMVLGLGIGVTNFQAVLVNPVCVRGLPIPGVDRVLFLSARDAQDREQPLSYREFEELRSATHGLSDVAAFASAPMVIGDEGQAPDRALGVYLSAGAFHLLVERPLRGRDFGSSDDRPGAPAVAILARSMWQSRYGGDPSIVGRTVRVNGVPTVIIGVMPDRFRFPFNTDVWLPLASMPEIASARRTERALDVIGRLADTTTLPDVSGQLDANSRRMAHDYPATNTGVRIAAVTINHRYSGRLTDSVWIAFIGVGIIVLLIACANAANLLLMRSATRRREMALRASLGASRAQLVRQLLVESAVLATLGGLVGTTLSLVGVRAIAAIIPANALPYWVTFTMDGRVFALLCAVCLGTVFVFGLAPAIHLSRTDVNQIMKDGGRGGSAGVGARRWTTAFLTAEFALTTVMLAGLLVTVRMTRAAVRAAAVIDPAHLVTTSVTLPADRYASPRQRATFYGQLEERLTAIPVLSSVAFTTALPMAGASERQLAIADRPAVPGETPLTAGSITIGPRYFDVLSVPGLRGRPFGELDGAAGHEVAIVNQRFARLFSPDADVIGRRIKITDASVPGAEMPWLTIVGVSPTVRQGRNWDPDPVVYLPLRAEPPISAQVIVRARTDATPVGPLLREVVRGIDPEVPLQRVMSMDDALAESQWNGHLSTVILNGIVLVAACLAAVGVYAVTSHAVALRSQEIGIRVALGAPPTHVVAIVLRRACGQLVLGLAAGVGCTFAWERFLGGSGSSDYHWADPVNLAGVSVLLTVIAGVACVLPARRATALDPAIALRHE
jgi:putative ABC transport system permease protein